MIVTLAAALSLAASTAIAVPYLPQDDLLCGGAAAAMVFRYWGDAHADPREFARFVDRRAGGITTDALAGAVRARGWRTTTLAGGVSALRERLLDGHPVILLLAERGTRFHYVVATGASGERVTFHDPSWGPAREITVANLEMRWAPANRWGLVIDPPAGGVSPQDSGTTSLHVSRDGAGCESALSAALDELRRAGLRHADSLLDAVRRQCPTAIGPLRELAGVRFAQKRWPEAAALARQALERDPDDAYSLDVLGSSLFVQDDISGALRAWNRLGKPRVNLVRIEGVHRVRYETLADLVGIRPNELLTADVFERAKRRLESLPDRSSARIAMRPEADGFASVDVVVVERPGVPRHETAWAAEGARAAVTRTLAIDLPGATGQGELWSSEWRFWPNRPRVGLAFTAPHAFLPGVWRAEVAWEAQTFAPATASAAMRETRWHGGVSTSDWMTAGLRYSLSAGVDAWNGRRRAVSLGGALERRWWGERGSVEGHATDWMALDSFPGFRAAGLQLGLRSSSAPRGWVADATIGAERVDDAAPMGLWPGAGEGQARPALLRAHPLLDGGTISTGGASAFGRSLTYGTAEIRRWLDRPLLVRAGLAGFVDVGRSTRRAAGDASPTHLDIGGGVRLRVPGQPGALRIDVARGLRDGATALTVGWQY